MLRMLFEAIEVQVQNFVSEISAKLDIVWLTEQVTECICEIWVKNELARLVTEG